MRRLVGNALCLTTLVVVIASTVTKAADWGTVKGRFVLDGPLPERPKLEINKDVEFCGKHEPRTEKMVVHRDDRGVANVVIWLDMKSGEKVASHPSFAESATAKIKLANKGCRFDPHVCVLRTGQTLLIDNVKEQLILKSEKTIALRRSNGEQQHDVTLKHDLTGEEIATVIAGGLINEVRQHLH